MKNLIKLGIGASLFLGTITSHADIVSESSSAAAAIQGVSSNVVSAAQSVTNINQAVVSILMGAKSVGSDLYSVSKDAIGNSVSFVQAQAPDVVRQFLIWNLVDNLVYYVIWIFVSIVIFWTAYRIHRYGKDNEIQTWCNDDKAGNWMCKLIAILVGFGVFLVDTANYGETALQIFIAPKVYLLQYVINVIQNHR